MVMGMQQVYQGMASGRPSVIAAPQTPASSLTVAASAGVSNSGAPLAILMLAALGGLVVLYWGTRSIQGTR